MLNLRVCPFWPLPRSVAGVGREASTTASMLALLSQGLHTAPPQRAVCQARTNTRFYRREAARRPAPLKAIQRDEWSLFERSEESPSALEEKATALLDAPTVPESSSEEENIAAYIQLNRRLVKAASNVLHIIHSCGPSDPASHDAAQKLIGTYEYLIQQHPVNIVNCVTLVHRLGSVFLTLDSKEELFERSIQLLRFVSAFLSQVYKGLDARQISNIVWALGCIGRPLLALPHSRVSTPELYSLLFTRMLELHDYRPLEIASCMSGLGRMGFKPQTCRSVLEHLTQLASEGIHQFGPQELASVLWGLGCLLYAPENDFIEEAAVRTAFCLREFSPKQMSNLTWGFARLDSGKALTYLLPPLERFFVREISDFSEQGISVVLWSFAKLTYLPERATMDKAMHVVKQRLPKLSAQSVTNICYACAIFGYTLSPDVATLFKTAFQENRSQFSAQLTCLFVWSLAVMFSLDLELFEDVMAEMGSLPWRQMLSESDKRQLYQCMIHAQFFIPGGNGALESVSKELILAAQQAWEQGQISKRTDAVCLAAMIQLQKLGYIPECHFLASRGLARFSVNIVHRASSSERIAVEITIPKHRFTNEAVTVEGPRQWAMALLRKKGFKILNIDAEQWKKRTATERIHFLKQLLADLNLNRGFY